MSRHTLGLIALLTVITTIPAIAQTIWRVDNNPGTKDSADFDTLQAAIASDDVMPGDFIYVMGSGMSYGNIIVSKELSFFGPGYFLSENPETQAHFADAKLGQVICDQGSDGSTFTGLHFLDGAFLIGDGDAVSGVSLRRNLFLGNFGNAMIRVQSSSSNIDISQNYIQNTATNISDGIFVSDGSNLIKISNNFIRGFRSSITSSTSAFPTVHNNVIRGPLVLHNANIKNNILREGSFSKSNNAVFNNMSNEAQFGTDNGNLSGVDMNTVFVPEGTTDGKWQLAENSPARGSGENGADMGMFGGLTPYVLSGLPNIPAIYFFSAPQAGTTANELMVRLKVKSHN